jgi:hypothetical protein
VRLATCVAIELGVGAVLAAGALSAALWGAAAFDAGLGLGREAMAASGRVPAVPPALSSELPRVVDRRGLALATSPDGRPGSGEFFGELDELLLDPLRRGAVTRVKFNRGGSSLSLRLDFDNGARAAFKPDQTNLQTVPRKEVAAYRLARLLGLGNVAPAIGRRFTLAELEAALPRESRGMWNRFLAETIRDGEWVTGQLSHWIPRIVDASVEGKPIDSAEGVAIWQRNLTVGNVVPDEDVLLVRQLSDLLVFDYVANNPDRWSGNNTKGSPDRRALYFMDNAMALGPDPRGHSTPRSYFERSQRFSRRLVARLRGLDEAAIRAALSWEVEPFAELLTDAEIAAILVRRDAALAHVDALIAAHGEAEVLVFP